MAETYQRNVHCICVNNWQGQATYASPSYSQESASSLQLFKAALTNKTAEKRHLLCTQNAFKRVGVQFISAHALEHGSKMTDVIFNI